MDSVAEAFHWMAWHKQYNLWPYCSLSDIFLHFINSIIPDFDISGGSSLIYSMNLSQWIWMRFEIQTPFLFCPRSWQKLWRQSNEGKFLPFRVCLVGGPIDIPGWTTRVWICVLIHHRRTSLFYEETHKKDSLSASDAYSIFQRSIMHLTIQRGSPNTIQKHPAACIAKCSTQSLKNNLFKKQLLIL